MTANRWLQWVQTMQTIAQAGLTYTRNPFDRERYHKLMELAAQILAEGAQIDLPGAERLMENETGYATPKLDVRGVVFRDDRILLVKELADGGWTLPGGWIDLNEPPTRAAEREVWEESGYQVRAVKLLGVYDRNQHGYPVSVFHTYKLFIQCDLLGGEAATSIETGGAEFFTEDGLPPLSLQRTSLELVHRMFDHHRHPEWPADLD
jgi:ADP-ribose pyrophosphatase YjhB (NUDIX family)